MAITSNMRDVADAIARATKKLPDDIAKLKGQVAVEVQKAVLLATPVKTGYARTNWRIQNASPSNEVIPKPSSPESGQAEALSQGKRAILTTKPLIPVVIYNNAPHITKLNRGWSVQAPSNFVRIAVEAAIAGLRNRTVRIMEIK